MSLGTLKVFCRWMYIITGFVTPFCLLQRSSLADELDAILRHGCVMPRRLSSIEFTSSGSHNGVARNYRYYTQGNNYRQELTIGNSDGGNLLIAAYNGRYYQDYLGRSKALSKSDHPMRSRKVAFDNPLIVPYQWLLDSSADPTWTSVKDPKVWEALRSTAVLVGRETVEDQPCVILELSGQSEYSARVALATNLGYLPLQYVVRSPEGTPVSFMHVRSYKSFVVDGETLWVPTDVEKRQIAYKGITVASQSRYSIIPATLKVNQPIDASLFTLSASNARVVREVDKPNSHPTAQRGSLGYVAGAIGAIVICVLAAALVWRRYRS
jgi:hypothetical protein